MNEKTKRSQQKDRNIEGSIIGIKEEKQSRVRKCFLISKPARVLTLSNIILKTYHCIQPVGGHDFSRAVGQEWCHAWVILGESWSMLDLN